MAYIDLSPIWGRGSMLNMCLSDRSDGKTTQIKSLIIDDFRRNGKAPIFLRRFMTEYTNDVINDFFTDAEFKKTPFYKKIEGCAFEARPLKDMKGKTIGYNIFYSEKGSKEMRPAVLLSSLSTVARLKSALSYERYRDIFIDEYIPLDNRYTANEVLTILETYKTIDRNHLENKILICGNKITRFNPIFKYWNIKKWGKGITQINPEFSLLVWSSKENKARAQKDRFATLTKGTEYEQYNAGEFLVDYSELIRTEHYKGAFLYLVYNGKYYGAFWGVDCLVMDETTQPRDNVPRVCITPCSPDFGRVLWLDSVPQLRDGLEWYKYNNKLFFADEITLDILRPFYNKI